MEEINGLERVERVLHSELAGLVYVLEWVVAAVDLMAIAAMLVGTIRFAVGFVRAELLAEPHARARLINAERQELGRYILAGLELFIVSDIAHTALSLALSDLIFLAVLVAIRAVISFVLDREIREIKDDPER